MVPINDKETSPALDSFFDIPACLLEIGGLV
jgi:hypothetical protein